MTVQIKIDESSFRNIEKIVTHKVEQLEYMLSPNSKTEISKAIFTITARRFLKDLSHAARNDEKRYHHLYESNKIGSDSKKLFIIKRSKIQYGELIISFVPLKSTEPVRISERLLRPGPTGKKVTARSIFRNKMEVMESNKPIHILTKKTIVFSPDGENLVFVPKNKIINIMSPGGKDTTNALQNFANTWYSTKAEIVVKQSDLFKRIASRVGVVVNRKGSSKSDVLNAIKQVTSKYSNEIGEL
jgi:hypothetical protein